VERQGPERHETLINVEGQGKKKEGRDHIKRRKRAMTGKENGDKELTGVARNVRGGGGTGRREGPGRVEKRGR